MVRDHMIFLTIVIGSLVAILCPAAPLRAQPPQRAALALPAWPADITGDWKCRDTTEGSDGRSERTYSFGPQMTYLQGPHPDFASDYFRGEVRITDAKTLKTATGEYQITWRSAIGAQDLPRARYGELNMTYEDGDGGHVIKWGVVMVADSMVALSRSKSPKSFALNRTKPGEGEKKDEAPKKP